MAAPEVVPIRRRAHIALFDATTLTAKGVKEQLVARSFPTASVRLFTSRNDPDSNLTEFAGQAMLVTEPDLDSLGKLDIAFLCGTDEEGRRYLDWPGRGGFMAIDLTSASNASREIPLVNYAVNPEAIPAGPGVIATPRPVAQILSSLLAPIRSGPGLREAVAVVLQPASEYGDEGVEELYQQAVGLLNFRDIPTRVFGRQLAFNLIPSSVCQDGRLPGGASPGILEEEVRKVTGGGYDLSVQVVLAPVFHCHALMAHVVLPEGGTAGDLVAALEKSGQVRVGGADGGATPVERAGQEGVMAATVRPAHRDSSFWIWAVADNLAAGTSLNAVRIAEALLADGPGRSAG
jgi:aspartate-semialdehyde dehydrogenase